MGGADVRRRARGAALLAVLSIIACLAIIAALYAVQAQHTARATANSQELLDTGLLALSACEELAAWLTIGCTPPHSAVRSVTNRAGVCVGTYAMALEAPGIPAAAASYDAAWYRDRTGRWRQPVPVYAGADAVARGVRSAMRRVPGMPVRALGARLADALDPDDELGAYAGMAGCEALAPAVLQASREMYAVPLARYDTAAWLHAGRLARGWGERYTAPMHLTVVRRLSHVSSRRASLVFSLANLEPAARLHADALRALQLPDVHALGAAHQWRGTWIKAVGRDTDSCLGGALTNLMWLRVIDNVIEGEAMRFECEPALEDTFADQFLSNALSGSITYGMAGWHTHGDPLLQQSTAQLTDPALAGLLAPARCAAELADAQPQVYIGSAAILRALDPGQQYTVVLHAPDGAQPQGLEIWHNHTFSPVHWDGTRAVLFDGAPQQPLVAVKGEGVLLLVFRAPAAVAQYGQGLAGIELAAAPPSSEWQATTAGRLDVRLWELAWLSAAGRTQVLQRVPLRCQGEVPCAPAAARVRFAAGATRVVRDAQRTTVPVTPVWEGPCARAVDVQYAGTDPVTGLDRYRVALAGTLRAQPLVSNWWVRVWPSMAAPDRGGHAGATNLPFALYAERHGAQQLMLHVPPGNRVLQHALVPGVWLENVSDWLAWGGALILRTPRAEMAARIAANELPAVRPGVAVMTAGWPPRWRVAQSGARPPELLASHGCTRNTPVATWPEFAELLPAAVRSSPALAAACADVLTLLSLPAELSNANAHAAAWALNGAVALSNMTLHYSWPPLPRDILRGYVAELRVHNTGYRGLILSNDHTRIVVDMPGRAPRAVDSALCRITTPYGECVWYLAGGATAEYLVPAPWPDTHRARLALSFLQPSAADIAITLAHEPSHVATQLVASSRTTWAGPPLHLGGATAPLHVRLRAGLPGQQGVLFTRPVWLLCAAPPRPALNALARADACRVLPLSADVRRTLLAARPLASMSDCAARVPLAADDIWRMAAAVSFHAYTMHADVCATAAGSAMHMAAAFTVLPREGQTTATVLYRLQCGERSGLTNVSAFPDF